MKGKSKTPLEMEEMANELVRILYHGHDWARTRSDLCYRMNLNDRALRKLVEIARNNGAMICNDGEGYYLAETQEEIERQYRREKSRMVHHWNAMRPFYEEMKKRGLPT